MKSVWARREGRLDSVVSPSRGSSPSRSEVALEWAASYDECANCGVTHNLVWETSSIATLVASITNWYIYISFYHRTLLPVISYSTDGLARRTCATRMAEAAPGLLVGILLPMRRGRRFVFGTLLFPALIYVPYLFIFK